MIYGLFYAYSILVALKESYYFSSTDCSTVAVLLKWPEQPNPYIAKRFNHPIKQHLPTLKPEQLPTLMAALSVASIKITTRCVIEWQLHTMTRPSEAAGTQWDEIDSDNSLWHIPAERMKKKKTHSTPLSPPKPRHS